MSYEAVIAEGLALLRKIRSTKGDNRGSAQPGRRGMDGGNARAFDARGSVGRPSAMGAAITDSAPRAAGEDAARPTGSPRNAVVPRLSTHAGEPGSSRFLRCCRLHPSVEVVEGAAGPLWCSTGHEVRSWLIRDLLTGRIVGRSHWLNGGDLDAGAFEPMEPSPEPPRCPTHDVPLRPRADNLGNRCPSCKRAGIQRARRERERSATA